MAARRKRFTVSLSPEMDQLLHTVKQKYYPSVSQSEMLRDLIGNGLKSQSDETLSNDRSNQDQINPRRKVT